MNSRSISRVCVIAPCAPRPPMARPAARGSGGMKAKRWAPFQLGLTLLLFWEVMVRVKGVPVYILPGPLLIALTLWRDGPSLLGSWLVTISITGLAFLMAILLGGGLAVLFSQSRTLARSLFPYAVI